MTRLAADAGFYRQLGERIRTLRKRRKLSQDALAKLVGLSRTSLTNIEIGRQHPPLHTFCEIVEQLEVDFSELLPHRMAAMKAVDVEALAGTQVRGHNELAFIETGIRVKGKEPHGDTAAKNPRDRRRAPD